MAKTYQWTGAGAFPIFSTAGNWIDKSTGTTATTAPQAGDTADFTGAFSVYGTGTVANLNVFNTTSSGIGFNYASIDANHVSAAGDVSISNGSTLAADTIRIGSATAGGLFDVYGGTLTALQNALAITVSGAETTLQNAELLVGSASPLDLGDGSLVVGTGANLGGTLTDDGGTVSGDGTSTLVIGAQGGAGNAQVNAGTLSIGKSVSLGVSEGFGILSLQLGSQLTAGDSTDPALIMGTSGTATTFGLPDQGVLQSSASTITLNGLADVGVSTTGSLSLSGGSLTTLKGLVLGVKSSGQGVATLLGANWTDQGNVFVGESGFGTLDLGASFSQTGTTTINGAILLGATTQNHNVGSGQITLTGVGMRVNGLTQIGIVSQYASELLPDIVLVQSGADWDSSGQKLSVNSGSFTVTGTESALSAGQLNIGHAADVAILAGAMATLGTNATGTAMIAAGAVMIDESSVSALGAIGVSDGATISLSGSTLSTVGRFAIGDLLVGQATGGGTVLLDGGSITSTAGTTGAPALEIGGTTGTDYSQAILTSANWSVQGNVAVGVAGVGELALGYGATMEISGALDIGAANGLGVVTTSGETVIASTGAALASGNSGITAASIVLVGVHPGFSTGSLEVGTAQSAGTLVITQGVVSVSTDSTINSAVHMSGTARFTTTGTLTVAQTGVVAGSGTVTAGSIVDLGRISAFGGTMTFAGPITGTGLLTVTQGGTAVLQQAVASTISVEFDGAGTLTTPSIADISSVIHGWSTGDAIDFAGVKIASDSLSGHTLSLFDSSNHLLGTEIFATPISASNFTLTADQGTGTDLLFHS
jgi:hypothetical protein